jgi:hypothetical protein
LSKDEAKMIQGKFACALAAIGSLAAAPADRRRRHPGKAKPYPGS